MFLASFARRWLYLREENCCAGHNPSFREFPVQATPGRSRSRIFVPFSVPSSQPFTSLFHDSSLHNLSFPLFHVKSGTKYPLARGVY